VEMTRSALHIDAILIKLNCCSKSDAAIGTNRSTRMNNQGFFLATVSKYVFH